MYNIKSLSYYSILCEKGIIEDQQQDLNSFCGLLQDKQFEYLKRLETTKVEDRKKEINEILNIIDMQLEEANQIKGFIASGIVTDNEESEEVMTQTTDIKEDQENKAQQKPAEKKRIRLIVIGIIILIAIALLVFLIAGQSKIKDSEGNTPSETTVSNGASSDYYGITSGQLEDKLNELFQSDSEVEVKDLTSEVFDDHGTLGFKIYETPSFIMMVYTQNATEPFDYDSPIDCCCFVSEISEYSSDYISKSICEIISSSNNVEIKETIDDYLNQSKTAADEDPSGQDHLVMNPLSVDGRWTIGCVRLAEKNIDYVVLAPKGLSVEEILSNMNLIN